jgi:hypothetical protein
MDTAAAAERGQEEIVVIMHQVCFFLAWGILYNTWMRATRRIWTMGGELGSLDQLQWVPPCAPRKWRHKSLCGFILLIPRIWGQYDVPNPPKSISSSITGREIRPSANWTLDSCVAASTIQPCTQTRPRFRV